MMFVWLLGLGLYISGTINLYIIHVFVTGHVQVKSIRDELVKISLYNSIMYYIDLPT